MLDRLRGIISTLVPTGIIEDVIRFGLELEEVLAMDNFWLRFGALYDLADRRLNGEMEWQGETIAQPHKKEYMPVKIVVAMAVVIFTTYDVVLDIMREGTQYDKALLPTEEEQEAAA